MNNIKSETRGLSKINLNSRIAEVYKYVGLSILVAAFGAFMGIQNVSPF